jgi:hypothetical protein
MALVAVEGVYRDGRVELAEIPSGLLEQARVIVTFLPTATENSQDSAIPSEDARREAGWRLMARLHEGIPFGGPPYPRREEFHDRNERYEPERAG